MHPPDPPALSLPTVAVPGQPLAPSDIYTAGPGVHLFNSHLCASIVGIPTLHSSTISIHRRITTTTTLTTPNQTSSLLPKVGDTVLALVTRINPRQATVSIFGFANDVACPHDFQGVIRAQDVRATEKDKVKIFASFRPGDAVRAQVISLGDQSNYYLSTASNSLGVVFARSDSGDALHPLNWRQMASSRTGMVEDRKVAKPI